MDPWRLHARQSAVAVDLCKCDVFSFGMILWAMGARSEPHSNMEPEQVVQRLEIDPSYRLDLPGTAVAVCACMGACCWFQLSHGIGGLVRVVVAIGECDRRITRNCECPISPPSLALYPTAGLLTPPPSFSRVTRHRGRRRSSQRVGRVVLGW